MNKTVIGIDISKSTFDIALLKKFVAEFLDFFSSSKIIKDFSQAGQDFQVECKSVGGQIGHPIVKKTTEIFHNLFINNATFQGFE